MKKLDIKLFVFIITVQLVYATVPVLVVNGQNGSASAKSQLETNISLIPKIESVTIKNEGSTSVSIDFVLSLEIVNKGSADVIFARQQPPEIVLAVLTKSSGSDWFRGKIALDYWGEATDTSSKWLEMRHDLDKKTPPVELVRRLKSNETWRFSGKTRISVPTDLGKQSIYENRESWENLRKLDAVWFRVACQVWSLNIEPISSDRTRLIFGKRLQQNWSKYGHLWLDDIVSEPILLDLDSLVSK